MLYSLRGCNISVLWAVYKYLHIPLHYINKTKWRCWQIFDRYGRSKEKWPNIAIGRPRGWDDWVRFNVVILFAWCLMSVTLVIRVCCHPPSSLSSWRWTERWETLWVRSEGLRGQWADTSSMRLRSRGKYWQKFWEIIRKFQDIITNKILGLTHRERNLLDKMQKENEEKQKSSISYIIVRIGS